MGSEQLYHSCLAKFIDVWRSVCKHEFFKASLIDVSELAVLVTSLPKRKDCGAKIEMMLHWGRELKWNSEIDQVHSLINSTIVPENIKATTLLSLMNIYPNFNLVVPITLVSKVFQLALLPQQEPKENAKPDQDSKDTSSAIDIEPTLKTLNDNDRIQELESQVSNLKGKLINMKRRYKET